MSTCPPFFCFTHYPRRKCPPYLQPLIYRFHFKCINLSDEQAEKIRKYPLPVTRPVTDEIDDYICQDCHEATGKNTTSKSKPVLIPLTSLSRVSVDSTLCHPLSIHYRCVYCFLGSSALLCSILSFVSMDDWTRIAQSDLVRAEVRS